MHGGAGREGVVEKRLEPPVELGRLEPRADHRYAFVARHDEQLCGRVLALRDDHARQGVGEKRLNRGAARLRVEGREIGDLGLAQDVDAVGADEPRRVSRQHEARTRRLRRADLAVESDLSRQQLELQRIPLAGEEIADLEPRCRRGWRGRRGGVHRVSGTLERRAVRRARRVSFSSSSWRFIRAIAASSAERWSAACDFAT